MKSFLTKFIFALLCCALFAGVVSGQTRGINYSDTVTPKQIEFNISPSVLYSITNVSKQYLSDNKYSLACFFADGLLDCTTEMIRYDKKAFFRVFPNANPEFWDINLCGGNKWKGGLRENGEAFPGSSSFFAWTRDGYHLTRTGSSILICIGQASKNSDANQSFKYRLVDAIIHQSVKAIGYTIAERLIYKH